MTRDAYVSARLTREEWDAFDVLAKGEGVSKSNLLRQFIREALTYTETTEWV